jgi:hypothetical protein
MMFGEDNMLNALLRSPPDAIVVATGSYEEYGVGYFGEEAFCRRTMDWIRQNYHEGARTGEVSAGYGMVLYTSN